MLNVQNTVIVMSHCENTVSNSVVLPEHKIFFFIARYKDWVFNRFFKVDF